MEEKSGISITDQMEDWGKSPIGITAQLEDFQSGVESLSRKKLGEV